MPKNHWEIGKSDSFSRWKSLQPQIWGEYLESFKKETSSGEQAASNGKQEKDSNAEPLT